MKLSITLLIFLVAAFTTAQVKFTVDIGGKEAGTASLTQRIHPDGSKSVDLRLDLKIQSQKLTIRSQNSYDKFGNPIRKFMDSNIPGGSLQKQVVATFSDRGASVVQIDGGKRTTREITLVSAAPRSNPSEFWFLRDRPKVGTEIKCYQFNMDSLAWDLRRVVYHGQKSIKIGGKTVLAHEIETISDRSAKAYLDDDGLPWMMEAGAATLKRVGS